MIRVLVPIWIGIVINVVLSGFHLSSMHKTTGRFRRWYFAGNNSIAMVAAIWAVLLAWSAYEFIAGRA